MVGSNEDIRIALEPKVLQRSDDRRKVVVRYLDRSERGRTIDAGNKLIDAVALGVLGAVRIGRPVQQHERPLVLLEMRQQHLGDDVPVIFLLNDIGGLAGVLALRPSRGFQRQSGLLEHVDDIRPQHDAVLLAGIVVEKNRGLAVELGKIVDPHRPDLAEGGSEVALFARGRHDRALGNEVTAVMLIELAQHRIVLDEGSYGSGCACNRKAGVERVTEISGVADQVTGRDHRGVGGGNGRIERMTVREVDTGVPHPGECGGSLGRDRRGPKTIGDEQDDVLLSIGWQRARQHSEQRADDPFPHGAPRHLRIVLVQYEGK